MISASPRPDVGALGDQPHPVEAGLLDREHGLPDLAEGKPRVPLDHDLDVRLRARRRAEAVAERLDGERLVVDPERAVLVDRDHDPDDVGLLARLGRGRQVDLRSRPLPHVRGHHHEDDEQHQHHVDERRDVDGRLHLAGLTELHELPFAP